VDDGPGDSASWAGYSGLEGPFPAQSPCLPIFSVVSCSNQNNISSSPRSGGRLLAAPARAPTPTMAAIAVVPAFFLLRVPSSQSLSPLVPSQASSPRPRALRSFTLLSLSAKPRAWAAGGGGPDSSTNFRYAISHSSKTPRRRHVLNVMLTCVLVLVCCIRDDFVGSFGRGRPDGDQVFDEMRINDVCFSQARDC
jgi:hypothetical protein